MAWGGAAVSFWLGAGCRDLHSRPRMAPKQFIKTIQTNHTNLGSKPTRRPNPPQSNPKPAPATTPTNLTGRHHQARGRHRRAAPHHVHRRAPHLRPHLRRRAGQARWGPRAARGRPGGRVFSAGVGPRAHGRARWRAGGARALGCAAAWLSPSLPRSPVHSSPVQSSPIHGGGPSPFQPRLPRPLEPPRPRAQKPRDHSRPKPPDPSSPPQPAPRSCSSAGALPASSTSCRRGSSRTAPPPSSTSWCSARWGVKAPRPHLSRARPFPAFLAAPPFGWLPLCSLVPPHRPRPCPAGRLCGSKNGTCCPDPLARNPPTL